jgi:hypothetical protein
MKSMPCAERNKNLYSFQELTRKNHTPNQQRPAPFLYFGRSGVPTDGIKNGAGG